MNIKLCPCLANMQNCCNKSSREVICCIDSFRGHWSNVALIHSEDIVPCILSSQVSLIFLCRGLSFKWRCPVFSFRFLRELQERACQWYYDEMKAKFRRFGSAKVVRSLYKRQSECKQFNEVQRLFTLEYLTQISYIKKTRYYHAFNLFLPIVFSEWKCWSLYELFRF